MRSERTSPLERIPTRRLPARRSRPLGSRHHLTPYVSSPYSLALDAALDAPALTTPARPAMPIPAHAPTARALQVEVIHRVEATASAVTLWLARPGTREAPAPYLPGQFTTLALFLDGITHYRSYSLCGDGSTDWPWEITIKREGLVSSALCDEVMPGALLRVSAPRGAFTLPSPLDPHVPLIFVAAGSGITPIYGMVRAIASLPPEQRPPVQLHYATRDMSEMIFRRELPRLDPSELWLRQWRYVSTFGERLTPARLLDITERHGAASGVAHWYICTPEALKHNLVRALQVRSVPATHIHMEVFTSATARPRGHLPEPPPHIATSDNSNNSDSQQHTPRTRLRLAESDTILDTQPGETLLETLERHGYQQSFGCRAGACGECKLRVLSGHVAAPETGVLMPAERNAGYVQSCIARPHGDVTLSGVASPAGEVTGAARATGKIAAATPPSHRGFRAFMRVAVFATTIGLFTGAWLLTSPSPSLTPTSTTPGASQSIQPNAPADHPISTPVPSGVGN